ncbi:hypothetical protein J2T60_002420 [Natronospira proteinivora]|uniref:Porin n=1 Tax=Natronospira proteinivora TaxID=1807133 RepID=A0ABT1GAR2_9GAMM|nr:DcaP family trimeric outer membrane transporter [Natronospira proteinivora]MCP1728420.1 hypothetical protein [Natronospira proteinivora]
MPSVRSASYSLLCLLFLAGWHSPLLAADDEATLHLANAHQLSYGGYLKLDVIASRYSEGRLPARSVGRDFYVPATIPVGGESAGVDTDMHIKETRFWLATDSQRADGPSVATYLEFDFTSGAPGGDERISNAYSPGIRHAYATTGNWLIGQTWTSFFKVEALAENLDFIGPTEGTVFVRQPQIRYQNGPWQFSMENPETTVTPHEGGDRLVTDTGVFPDMVARYNHSADWGSLSLSALLRDLAIDTDGERERQAAWGVSVGSRVTLSGDNDLRFMASHGDGIGRYLGLNASNDAVLDAQGRLQTIPVSAAFLSYRHHWHQDWRSNLTLSGQWIDNDTDLTGADNNISRRVASLNINLIHNLAEDLFAGVEYSHARRTLETGERGSMDRLQFSIRYDF